MCYLPPEKVFLIYKQEIRRTTDHFHPIKNRAESSMSFYNTWCLLDCLLSHSHGTALQCPEQGKPPQQRLQESDKIPEKKIGMCRKSCKRFMCKTQHTNGRELGVLRISFFLINNHFKEHVCPQNLCIFSSFAIIMVTHMFVCSKWQKENL